MNSNFRSQDSRYNFPAIDENRKIRRGYSSSPEYYPERFSRSRLNDATGTKRTAASGSRKRHFEDDTDMQYCSSDYEYCSSQRITSMKQDTSFLICTKRIKSSEVHGNSLNLQSYQNGVENSKLKSHKTCEKHSKRGTSFVHLSGENSKSVSQLQKLENHLKLISGNKFVKHSAKLKSTPESNSTKSNTKLTSTQKSKCFRNSGNLKSSQEIFADDIDADILILCIDEDEASDILFGDLKSKVLKSFNEHKQRKCNLEEYLTCFKS